MPIFCGSHLFNRKVCKLRTTVFMVVLSQLMFQILLNRILLSIYNSSAGFEEVNTEIMATEISGNTGAKSIEEGLFHEESRNDLSPSKNNSCFSVPFLQKLIAEMLGTFFLIFAGCAAVIVNLREDKVVTLPGIAITWGSAVMVMVYSLGHISGAHFNPAVTIAFATCRRFPLKQVPFFITAQLIGATLASGVLRLLFDGHRDHFVGTIPSGSIMQSLVMEFIISYYLMFVISGVSTDSRAIGELAGLAVGSTILLNVLIAGPISGASMNPARSLGPAIVWGCYEKIWVYLLGPTCGTICGAWAYNLIRFTDKPLREITSSGSFLKSTMGKK